MWRCAVRTIGKHCPATVSENDGIFQRNGKDHVHAAKPNIKLSAILRQACGNKGIAQPFVPSGVVVEKILTSQLKRNRAYPGIQKVESLKRVCNRKRQADRPKDPISLQTPLLMQHIPDGFLIGDVVVDEARHLMFATAKQLQILSRAKVWYMDGTFSVVNEPYKQMYSIHAFVKSGDASKQLPLLFILMSRRRKNDYVAVFNELTKIMNPTGPNVMSVMVDFERAIWSALEVVFPSVNIQGCAFHFIQALVKHLREGGLAQAYVDDPGSRDVLKQMLALCYMPHEWIPILFARLEAKCTTRDLVAFAVYMRSTWITSQTWNPTRWSVFNTLIRTNNHLEGWHRQFNTFCRSNMPFYHLIEIMFNVSDGIELQINLIREDQLSQCFHSKYKKVNENLVKYWDEFNTGDLSANALLKKCSRIYSPATISK